MLPFDPRSLRAAGYAEIQRIIRMHEPPKPSTRISALRSAAQTPPRRADEPVAQAPGHPAADALIQELLLTMLRVLDNDHPQALALKHAWAERLQ